VPRLELFHRLAEDDSAAARRLVREAGLLEAVLFRNVAFDAHRDALAARGGARTPALWDGARLHEGLAAVGAALSAAAEGSAGTADAPLRAAPAALLDASGSPRLGAFAGALEGVDLAALAGPGLRGRLRRLARAKRWTYALAVSDEVFAAVAVVEAGWFAGGFAWALDRASGAILWEGSATGLPGVHGRVGSRPGAGAHLASRGLSIEVAREGDRWRVAASAGRAFALEASLDAAAAPAPFTLVTRVPGGGVRATQKAARLGAAGRVRAAGRTLSLDGGAGGVDYTAGVLARETDWRWAFAAGAPGAGGVGFNLCEGFGVLPGDPGENAGFTGATYRLPPVAFTVGGVTAAEPWRIASGGGEVDLVFRPAGAHREARDLGLVRTRFTQVAGTFDGRIPGPGGERLSVAGLPGVVEDHRARW
jgi:hypothetical protein